MSVLLGIDLGTTNSLGCIYRNGRIELIPNRFQSFLTPSVVSLDEEDYILVGQIAKERLITCPERTVGSFKKYMGEEKKIRLGNRIFTPEELSSFVVRSIVDDAEAYLGEKIEEVVISVPAYFHDKQRYSTKKAGILAGVTVNRLINEPSAAALAAYLADGEEQMFLVFDFGGGTLDVSIVDCFETVVEIVAVAGDNHLGGDNFHDIMADSFLKEHGFSKADVSLEELALLRKQAEACKIELSTEETAKMNAWINGKAYVSTYTNQRLLEESASVFMRIKQVLTNAITSAGIQKSDLAGIVMAGGSSKMPIVSSYVEYLFRQQPVVDIHSDELIVRGLGYLCGVKARDESVKDYVLTDICPFSLGTAIHNESDLNNAYFSPIIQKNTVLPCSRVRRFYTVENGQKQIRIEVLQGEHAYAKDNRKLAEYTIAVPKKKAGEESVDVRFTYDIDGILMADMTVVSSGQTISKVVSQTVDDGEMEERMKQLEKLKVHPKDINENKLLLSRLEALFEEVGPQQREYVANLLRAFDSVLEEQNPRKIKRYRESFSNIIDQFEHYDPFADYSFWDDFYDEDIDAEEESEEDSAEEDLEFAEYTKKMEKLIAAEILKVSEDASVREIKKAYARMLREYHPEEYPEEFKRIQEAYEVLTDKENGNSGGGYSGELRRETAKSNAGRMERWGAPERGTDMGNKEAQESGETFDYGAVTGNEEDTEERVESHENAERDMDFERTEWKAQQEEKLRRESAIELAGKELEMIVNSRSLKHRLDSYEKFLRDERYRDILYEDGFILKACEILETADLKKEVYDIFADGYHFREYKPEQLKPSAGRFYKIIDKHCKISKKKNTATAVNATFIAVVTAIRSLSRNIESDWTMAILVLVVFAVMYNGFRRLVRYYTRWRIHMMYSLFIIVSQIIMLLADVYRKVLGMGADGDVAGVVFLFIGLLYFVVTAASYMVYKIHGKIKRF